MMFARPHIETRSAPRFLAVAWLCVLVGLLPFFGTACPLSGHTVSTGCCCEVTPEPPSCCPVDVNPCAADGVPCECAFEAQQLPMGLEVVHGPLTPIYTAPVLAEFSVSALPTGLVELASSASLDRSDGRRLHAVLGIFLL